MKKPIIFSVFFFIITAISSFGQDGGVWIEEVVDPDTGLRKGIIEFNDELTICLALSIFDGPGFDPAIK